MLDMGPFNVDIYEAIFESDTESQMISPPTDKVVLGKKVGNALQENDIKSVSNGIFQGKKYAYVFIIEEDKTILSYWCLPTGITDKKPYEIEELLKDELNTFTEDIRLSNQ